MSRENVERLRWLYGEWAKGNLWALGDIADPGIEWEWSERLASIEGGRRVCRGLDEIAADTRRWLSAWDHYWMTAEDLIEIGDEVVVLMRLHARTADTDAVLEQPLAAVWTFRDGRVARVRYYDERGDALDAVGLRE